MNRIIKGLGIALGCVLIASSCSEISFGDKFLGDQPESSGATTEEMFSSKINAEKVLTKAIPDYLMGYRPALTTNWV